MGIYDVIKDGVKVARDAGNIELSLKLAEVADDLLEKQKKIAELEEENKELREMKKYVFPEKGNWLIDPEHPNRKLCPHCTPKNKAPIPIEVNYCRLCKGVYE